MIAPKTRVLRRLLDEVEEVGMHYTRSESGYPPVLGSVAHSLVMMMLAITKQTYTRSESGYPPVLGSVAHSLVIMLLASRENEKSEGTQIRAHLSSPR